MLYKVLKPIAFGGRQEKGAVIDISEETANAIGDEYVVKLSEKEESKVEVPEEKDLDDMSVAELREKAIKLDLAKSGTKADLIERIKLALENPVEEDKEEEE